MDVGSLYKPYWQGPPWHENLGALGEQIGQFDCIKKIPSWKILSASRKIESLCAVRKCPCTMV